MQHSYLGAAPLVATAGILSVAGSILTVEARHQTLIRTLSKAVAVPGAFDTPLGVRAVFSLAAGFITSCPAGSNLVITPFPAATLTSSATPKIGDTITLTTTATGATACAFTNAGNPGGSVFTPFTNGACVVPQNLAGITYMSLTNASPLTGVVTDAITVAGVVVLNIS
jgi:hypothetical protein